MQVIRGNGARRGKHGNHVRGAHNHLDVVADYEDVGHALEALLLNFELDAVRVVAAV